MDIVIKEKDDSISWEEIHAVIKEAFQGYPTDYGIQSNYLVKDTEWLAEGLSKGITLVAINKENNQLLGTSTLLLANGRFKYGFNRTSAVIPSAGHYGIGAKSLQKELEICRQKDCQFLFSDTFNDAKVAHALRFLKVKTDAAKFWCQTTFFNEIHHAAKA